MNTALSYFHWKIEPRKIPSCLIPHLYLYLIYSHGNLKSRQPCCRHACKVDSGSTSATYESQALLGQGEKMFLVPLRIIFGGLLSFLIICFWRCWNRQKLPVIYHKKGCKKRRKTRKFSARLNHVNNISQSNKCVHLLVFIAFQIRNIFSFTSA